MQLTVFLFFTYLKIIAAAAFAGLVGGCILTAAVLAAGKIVAYIRTQRRETDD